MPCVPNFLVNTFLLSWKICLLVYLTEGKTLTHCGFVASYFLIIIGSELACCLFGANPLLELMLTFCQLRNKRQWYLNEIQSFSFKEILKWCLHNDSHFIQASNVLKGILWHTGNSYDMNTSVWQGINFRLSSRFAVENLKSNLQENLFDLPGVVDNCAGEELLQY